MLIPNLLAARERAFNTASQSCARSIATAQEVFAIDDVASAYGADLAALDADMVGGCLVADITVNDAGAYDADTWTVTHARGTETYTVGPSGITN